MKILFEDIEQRRNFTSCHDVLKSTQTRFSPAPVLNHFKVNFWKEVEDNDENYIIMSGVNHCPEDWTGLSPYSNVKPVFEYLSPKYLEDLQNNKAILLLDQSLEGYHQTWIFDFFHSQCEEYKVSPSNIVYLTGNLEVEADYAHWLQTNSKPEKLNVFGYAHFERDMYNLRRDNGIDTLTKTNIKYKRAHKIKLYNCLNKRDRNHRAWFYTKLFQADLLDDGLISMNNFSKSHIMDGKAIPADVIEAANKTLPRWIDEPNNILDDNYYIRRIRHDVCLDSYVSIISEAHFPEESNTLFISEKTFKIIACRHPFIILGNRFSLEKLRELGYKTFDGFINEEYDTLPSHQRMDAIIESIKELKKQKNLDKWYKNLQPILNHNYNNLKKRSIRKNSVVAKIENLYKKKFGDINV
jgi:hypothetical protein